MQGDYVNISEVSKILGLCNFLKVPKHVFITQEQIYSDESGKRTFYRGVQPQSKNDSIMVAANEADESTPIHEAVHALGFNEMGTVVLTRAIMRKNRIVGRLPKLRNAVQRNIVYQKVEVSTDYPWAHGNGFKNRVEHYVLSEFVETGNY